MTIFVVAGNYAEATDYAKQKQLTKGVFFVSSVRNLKGKIIGPKDDVVFVGTFFMRRDIDAIHVEIELCRRRSGVA